MVESARGRAYRGTTVSLVLLQFPESLLFLQNLRRLLEEERGLPTKTHTQLGLAT